MPKKRPEMRYQRKTGLTTNRLEGAIYVYDSHYIYNCFFARWRFMSRKPSHIPIFPDAYHRDTTHLTTEEHGAYFLLLMAAWGSDDCSLPNDARRLAALAKMSVQKWQKMAPTVLEFWTIEKGRLTQKRLLKEFYYVREKSEKARQAVSLRKDRNGYERSTNDVTNGLHLGGGGGEGVLSSVLDTGITQATSDYPFRVLNGGGK